MPKRKRRKHERSRETEKDGLEPSCLAYSFPLSSLSISLSNSHSYMLPLVLAHGNTSKIKYQMCPQCSASRRIRRLGAASPSIPLARTTVRSANSPQACSRRGDEPILNACPLFALRFQRLCPPLSISLFEFPQWTF